MQIVYVEREFQLGRAFFAVLFTKRAFALLERQHFILSHSHETLARSH